MDTGRGKAGVRVRSWCGFGQRKGKSRIQSPNLVQLRTQKGEISGLESEPGSTSDTKREKGRLRVRTRINSGHKKRKRALQSQNRVQLRTQKEKLSGLESEPGSTSDTKRENVRLRVRTRINFGHKKRK